jgi:hypothetical protein
LRSADRSGGLVAISYSQEYIHPLDTQFMLEMSVYPEILEALKNVMTTSQDRWPTDYGQQDAKSAAHSGNARLTLMVSTLGGGEKSRGQSPHST